MSNVKLLARPDARVQNMEAKMNTLADQLASLTLILKKGSSKRTTDRTGEIRDQYNGFEKGCSYCQKPGNSANKCPENPNRDIRCTNCGKMGHGLETCWSKSRNAYRRREGMPAKQNQVAVLNAAEDDSSTEDDSTSSDDEYDRNGFHVILDEEDRTGKFLAVKRGMDGQPVAKSPRTGPFDPMPIENILNPDHWARTEKRTKKKSKPAKKKAKRKSQPKRRDLGSEIKERYDVVSSITNAQSGLTFGQLWKGEAVNAKKELDKFFGKEKLKVSVVEASPLDPGRDETKEEKCLAVALVELHDTGV